LDIGRPKRIIEVEPVDLPIPETIPEPVQVPEPAPAPEREPADAWVEPAPTPSDR
jgi:hypothetical protein